MYAMSAHGFCLNIINVWDINQKVNCLKVMNKNNYVLIIFKNFKYILYSNFFSIECINNEL